MLPGAPVIARIWLGGPLRRSVSHELVLAIRRASVSTGLTGLEHITCQPKCIEGLLEARLPDGRLHLQHPDGKLEPIIKVCRRLGLTYRLWRGPTGDEGAWVEVWWPGLLDPVRLHGDPADPSVELVEAAPVRRAIKLLENNKACLAKHTLLQACPTIIDVPPLELVEDD